MDTNKLTELATALADENDADILLYNGPIERPYDDKVLCDCNKAKRRKNVIFILCTLGGDPNAGYRIARCLQQKYEKFTILIDGLCKSTGTLITVGANEIIMSDQGEMGPLDIQVGKKDELWETDSGLTVLSAIKALEEKSFDLFESCFLNLKTRSSGRITLKTATEMASKLAIGTISPIVAQIDPMHVGEVSRAMNIGLEYGNRLAKTSENTHVSKNPNIDTVQKLTVSYPSHGFVIDRTEAKDLFVKVREPTVKENELLQLLGSISKIPVTDPIYAYLSTPQGKESDESNNEGNNTTGPEAGGEGDSGNENAGGTAGTATPVGEVTQLHGKRGGKSAA